MSSARALVAGRGGEVAAGPGVLGRSGAKHNAVRGSPALPARCVCVCVSI